jgi:hypothetical protein
MSLPVAMAAGRMTAEVRPMKYGLRSPMRFSLRDLFWITVVVAMGLGWWVDRTRLRKWVDDLGHRVIKFDLENYRLRKQSSPLPNSSAPAPIPAQP